MSLINHVFDGLLEHAIGDRGSVSGIRHLAARKKVRMRETSVSKW